MSNLRLGSTRLSGADGVRAIACLSVILHHLSQKLIMPAQKPWLQDLQSVLLLGNSGVSLFFLLSGFLLSFPFWSAYLNNGPYPSLRTYTLRRAARIMPGFYVSLLVCLLLTWRLDIPMEFLGRRIAAAFTFTSGFHYTTFFPSDLNGPLWSISFEVFCYLLMPLFMAVLFMLGKRHSFGKAILFWVAVFGLVLAANALIHHWFTPSEQGRGWDYGQVGGAKFWMPRYNPVGFFGHFTIGILAAGITNALLQRRSRVERLSKLGVFDAAAVLALCLAGLLIWRMRHAGEFDFSLQQQPYMFPVYAILFGIVLFSAPFSRYAGRVLDNRFFRYTAKVSFGLYIWHYLFITLIEKYGIQDFHYSGVRDVWRWLGISLTVVAISYLAATLSFYVIEQPFINWSKGKPFFRRKPKEMPAEAAA
ncbi:MULTISPECIES: acyltransferase [unclassified Paenibacillus]|uniref:acyltransferase family protein n=1 Tax=unclassified Paenibacillus TaxID=185978 RepID=UPI0003E1DE7E|nr:MULTISPECIES: acyltransferase [unclassified Paenibacillus]ETT54591.1 acyltransferase 3 [Paenibacillus sp. FSL R7-269]OMF96934.1 acyltransferase [Paenibacillus sp. FSL R7-0337]